MIYVFGQIYELSSSAIASQRSKAQVMVIYCSGSSISFAVEPICVLLILDTHPVPPC